jgi:hypothetical protein
MRWSGMQSWLLASRPIVVDVSIEIVSPQRGPARTTSFGVIAIDAFKQNDCRAAVTVSEPRAHLYPIGERQPAAAAEARAAYWLTLTITIKIRANSQPRALRQTPRV